MTMPFIEDDSNHWPSTRKDTMESDPASRAPWPVPTHSIGETPTTGIVPTRIVLLEPEPPEPVLAAKPLEWEPAGADDYTDKHHGFYIAHQPDDEPDYRWMAAWGEGDSYNFATMAEAKAWCQEQLDAWVREFVVAPGPEPLQEVITWVPVEQAERPGSGETVVLMFDDGSWIRGYCDEAGATWYDADTCGQVSGFKRWARVKGPQ